MHAIRKPAKDGAATPWHQDEAYWDPAYEHRGLSIWIPLQPATLENGCMQFVPGSHHLGVQPHQLINPDSHGLELQSLELVEEAVACPLPPGGATIHFSRTLHYAGPNTSTEPRRALIMGFNAPGVPAARAAPHAVAAARVVRLIPRTERNTACPCAWESSDSAASSGARTPR